MRKTEEGYVLTDKDGNFEIFSVDEKESVSINIAKLSTKDWIDLPEVKPVVESIPSNYDSSLNRIFKIEFYPQNRNCWVFNSTKRFRKIHELKSVYNCNFKSRNFKNDNFGKYNCEGSENTGSHNVGSSNSGDQNAGDRNTGNQNVGSHNSGSRNFGWNNVGNQNVGSYNSGSRNFGWWNTGSQNIGNANTGENCIGYNNTGKYCTGNSLSGVGNVGSNTKKYLCCEKDVTIMFDEVVKKEDLEKIDMKLVLLLGSLLQSDKPIDPKQFLQLPNSTEEKIKKLHEEHLKEREKIFKKRGFDQ